jgi:fructose/tagatose bisphosphate aldolase
MVLADLLPVAQDEGYAIGAFSPRVTPLIRPVLLAGQHSQSPLIIQISKRSSNDTSLHQQNLRLNSSISFSRSISTFQ